MSKFYSYFDISRLKTEDYKPISLNKLNAKLFTRLDKCKVKEKVFTKTTGNVLVENCIRMQISTNLIWMDLIRIEKLRGKLIQPLLNSS